MAGARLAPGCGDPATCRKPAGGGGSGAAADLYETAAVCTRAQVEGAPHADLAFQPAAHYEPLMDAVYQVGTESSSACSVARAVG